MKFWQLRGQILPILSLPARPFPPLAEGGTSRIYEREYTYLGDGGEDTTIGRMYTLLYIAGGG